MNQRIMAFWSYDVFPYLLSSEVVKITPDGYVKTIDYGDKCFKPVLLLPLEEGEKVLRDLILLRNEFEASQRELLDSFKEKRKKLLSRYTQSLK